MADGWWLMADNLWLVTRSVIPRARPCHPDRREGSRPSATPLCGWAKPPSTGRADSLPSVARGDRRGRGRMTGTGAADVARARALRHASLCPRRYLLRGIEFVYAAGLSTFMR